MTALLEIVGLSKQFGGQVVLRDIDLVVEQGEFIALLGPSGCGKTTLLRCIAGFLAAETGRVCIAGEDVTDLPPYRRPLNTVFQNYALFPHMSVADNVAYGPRRRGAGRAEAGQLAMDALALVGMADMGQRMPRQLSGGQQQRVALARAVVNKPKLLLLDEPLSALDLKLRKRVQIELKQLQEKLGIAFVFVTHDQEEALTMADRVVVMNAGRIEQAGRGQDIYRSPSTRFVADFIGEANFLRTTAAGGGRVALALGAVELPAPGYAGGAAPVAVLRPEHIAIRSQALADGRVEVPAKVQSVTHVGSHVLVALDTAEGVLHCRIGGTAPVDLVRGASIVASFDAADVHLVAG
ncbi:spermidine/putrescine transport system ATP-binding protein [Stella humosa]|uniref:Spermidine/putrescine transport system ATP-binding protein n=1 Tax=Stella humosa TaxID=94 RepID=A0A3N1MFH9_9PROT|nr:ABC transporter ATP-binding protein [Stella humosa]ROQ01895.1 spermidine/putrescine transport system ATP-binding protein [Stella humosa]BBK32284.1 ABC transporter ATP-binding protein [Stella humosa]